jgi:hypothetical protein
MCCRSRACSLLWRTWRGGAYMSLLPCMCPLCSRLGVQMS